MMASMRRIGFDCVAGLAASGRINTAPARIDPQPLGPIQHGSEKAQTALMVIRVRAALITVRTSLVNTARGLAKAMGERLPKCDADQMGVLKAESMPPKLRHLLEPLLKEVESLTEKIKDGDRQIEQIAREDYPETTLLQQVGGVGPLIALRFVLTIHDKNRFHKSRDIGCYRTEAQAQRFRPAPTAATNHQRG